MTGPADRIGAKLDAEVPVTDRFDGTGYVWTADQPIAAAAVGDLWTWVRADVIRRLGEHVSSMPHEMRVIVAEDAAREVVAYATPQADGRWPLDV